MDRVFLVFEGIASGGPAAASSILFLAFGAAAAWLLGLRSPLLLVVAALPTGIGLLALTAQALGTLGLQTTLVMDAVVALAVAATIGAVRRRWTRGGPTAPADAAVDRLVWAGAASGAAVALAVWLGGIGNFALPPQSNDDIWHGYLVERLTHMPVITAGGVAPTFVDSATPVVYYPYGLHLAGASIHQLTGVSVAEVLNGAWIVYIGLLLPFGLAAAAWRLFPGRPWVAFWSGVLSAGVTAFPSLTNGVLPYTASLAMVPGLLALLLAYLDQRLRAPTFVLAFATIGVFVTHPAGALVAVLLGGLVAVERMLHGSRRDAAPALRRLGTAGALAAIGSLPWVLAVGTSGLGAPVTNAEVGGILPAAWMLLGLASPWTLPQPLLAALTVLGVVTSIVSRRAIAMTTGLLLFGALFIGVVAGMKGITDLTGPWYGNWYRLLAVVGLLVPILAGLGTATLVGLSGRVVARLAARGTSLAATVIAVAIGSGVAVAMAYDAAAVQSIVRTAWHAPQLVTAEDVQLLHALSDRLGPDDRVLNSPRDGSTWMYAMFRATPVLPYVYGPTLSLSDIYSGAGGYSDAGVACGALARLAPTYAVVKEVRGDIHDDAYDIAGFVSRNSDLFTLVLRGDAGAIYRVDEQAVTRCAHA